MAMSIDQMIEKLKAAKRKHGNIDVKYLIDDKSGFECGIYEIKVKEPDADGVETRVVLS